MLAASDFNCNEAARDKHSVRLWNQTAVDGEAIVAGEQRQFRLVVADFYGKRGAVGICGRMADWRRRCRIVSAATGASRSP